MVEGDTREVTLDLGEDNPSGKVTVTLKEIKEKVLPELDDELARSASEFETLAELRSDIESRLTEQLESELDVRFRQDALDALVDASTIDGVDPLVERRAAALLNALVRSLQQRGVDPETYLTMTGQTPEALQANARAEAERAVKRELVLEAVADQEAIEVSDDEIEALDSRGGRVDRPGSRRGCRGDARGRGLRADSRRPAHAQGDGPRCRRRHANLGRACARARQTLDAREGEGY